MQWIIILMMIVVSSCTSQHDRDLALKTPLPKNMSSIETIKPALEHITDRERKIVVEFLERRERGDEYIRDAKTIGDVIETRSMLDKYERLANMDNKVKDDTKVSNKAEALANVRIAKKDSWIGVADDGYTLLAKFVIDNQSVYDIKDIKITCILVGKSGTILRSNDQIIYDLVKARSKKRLDKVEMGYVPPQTDGWGCKIVDVQIN